MCNGFMVLCDNDVLLEARARPARRLLTLFELQNDVCFFHLQESSVRKQSCEDHIAAALPFCSINASDKAAIRPQLQAI